MIRLLRTLRNLWSDRHINRGFKQLEQHTRASERDEKAAWIAEIDARLAARKLLRPDRQKAARKGVETRRARA